MSYIQKKPTNHLYKLSYIFYRDWMEVLSLEGIQGLRTTADGHLAIATAY